VKKRWFSALLTLSLTLLTPATTFFSVSAWSNGGYSSDPSSPDYGTHDWLAHHALDLVPDNLDFWIRDNFAMYLYGTELPDNGEATLGDGIGDTYLHHVYLYSDGRLQDDSSARRAREAYDQVLSYLTVKDYGNAAKLMGVAFHYISDLAAFGHVMGSGTDWGSEKHHSDYEQWVNGRTDRYDSSFAVYLNFDGKLETFSAYDASLKLAWDTTFDNTGKGRTAKWMDDNYNPENPFYQERIGESLNLAVNLIADIIYSISQTVQTVTTTTTKTTTNAKTGSLITDHVVINEFEQNPPGDERYTGGEFIELFNPTTASVDIGGWTLSTTHGKISSYKIPAGTMIGPGPSWWVVTFSGQFIDNYDPDSVVLRDKAAREVDRTPAMTDTTSDDCSWQRIPDAGTDWQFKSVTKGFNNAPNPIPEFPSMLVVGPALLVVLVILSRRLRQSN